MHLSLSLSAYLGRNFLIGIGFVFGVFVSLVFLIDMIELLRRASGEDEASFAIVVQMAFLKLPGLAQKLLPFAALFGGIWTFSRLTRTNELIVTRAAGVSVWQFLTPALVIAGLIGVFVVTVFNPLASAMVSRYEHLESRYLEDRPSMLAFSSSGLWLRQADDEGQSVVHALSISAEGMELRDVIVFLYRGSDEFAGRIDAATARLEDGHWRMTDALLTRPDQLAEHHDTYRLPTSLTLGQIQDSFASPETLSFWSLPGFIDMLEAAGFSGLRHKLHWHAVLSTPLLLCAMVLLAATFSLRMTRRGGTGMLIALGVLTGFLLYFISDVVFALGMAGSIPVVLAAWTPTGVCALLGLAMLFHLEDG